MKGLEEKLKVNPQDRVKGSWVQTGRDGHKQWMKLSMDNPTASALLHCLVSQMGNKNAVVISHAILSKQIGKSVETVKRSLNYLQSRNWIQILKIGKGKECAYVINSRVAWCESRNNLVYSLFEANVIVDLENQDEWEDVELKPIPPLMFVPFNGEQH